ncbi:LysR family transcriptional regulator [Salinisphaera aquimarina]|uniref:LysR family transcriptional regulator n=1 Tax=Salinisphaera aquimarina TaxID=2094031 RepID=A0ABV7EMQ2_9GAMM
MDFRQLRYFAVLAETLNFGAAARRLHITQPPLSRQIAALESRLGVALFTRTSRSVALTAAGVDYHAHVLRLLDDVDRAERSARATAHGHHGELSVGFTMYAAWNLLPKLIRAFTDQRPQISIRLEETLPGHLDEALASARADVGIGFPSQLRRTLRYRSLFREPLCAVLPSTHRLAEQPLIAVDELAQEPFVTFPRTTAPALYEALSSCCARHGFEPTIRLETHLQQTIVNLVAAGLGVSLVPESMRRMQLPGAVFHPIRDAPLIEQGIYWSAHNHNPCLAPFLECSRALSTTGETM